MAEGKIDVDEEPTGLFDADEDNFETKEGILNFFQYSIELN